MPDWLWQRIEPLIPEPVDRHPLGCHRPPVPNRAAMDATLLVLRTGIQWNALDATRLCSSSSAHRRFQEWERAGVFAENWRQGLLEYDKTLLEYDKTVGIDWEWLAADGAITKAPLDGEKTGPNPTDRAKRGRNVRFFSEGAGFRSGWRPRAPTATITSCRTTRSPRSRSSVPRRPPRRPGGCASTRPTTTPSRARSSPTTS
jgi:putative transposase